MTRRLYLDSSALVKLVVTEPESAALLPHVRGQRWLSSALVLTEVPRALSARGTTASADGILRRVDLVDVDRPLLRSAGAAAPALLRSLDAIHLASVLRLGASVIDAVVCYDDRLRAAVEANLPIPVEAPA